MESVDHWPLAIVEYPDSRGEPLCGSRRSSACPWSLDPPSEGRMPQPCRCPQGRPAWIPCVRTGSWRAQWGQLDGRPRPAGAPAGTFRGGRAPSCAPARCVVTPRSLTILLAPSGVFSSRPGGWGAMVGGPSAGRPTASGSRRKKGSYLVDSASSHMLVSKIKPCMSKCKHFIL